jgi:hypothetical protein
MTETPPRPGFTEQALRQQQARREREAAALRANLRKRKEQARERQGEGSALDPPKGSGPLETMTKS